MYTRLLSNSFLCVLLLGVTHHAMAKNNEPKLKDIVMADKPIFHLNFENDFVTGTDSNYTTGFRLGLSNIVRDNSGLVKRFKGKGLSGKDYKLSAGFHIANNIYTGQDIDVAVEDIPADDRPYAGWTYLGVSKTRLYEDDSSVHYEFDVGCIGPCAGSDNIQKSIHRQIDSAEPQGWDNQIANDVAIQLFYDRHFPIKKSWVVESKTFNQRLFDFSPSVHAELGTVFNSVGVGANFRLSIGAMKSYFDGIGISQITHENIGGISNPSTTTSNSNPGLATLGQDIQVPERFLYFRTKARYMFYNATIEGGLFNDDSPFTQDIKDVVVDMELGVMVEFKRCNFNLFIAAKSTEVDAQSSSLTRHKWGGLNIAYKF